MQLLQWALLPHTLHNPQVANPIDMRECHAVFAMHMAEQVVHTIAVRHLIRVGTVFPRLAAFRIDAQRQAAVHRVIAHPEGHHAFPADGLVQILDIRQELTIVRLGHPYVPQPL